MYLSADSCWVLLVQLVFVENESKLCVSHVRGFLPAALLWWTSHPDWLQQQIIAAIIQLNPELNSTCWTWHTDRIEDTRYCYLSWFEKSSSTLSSSQLSSQTWASSSSSSPVQSKHKTLGWTNIRKQSTFILQQRVCLKLSHRKKTARLHCSFLSTWTDNTTWL